MKNKGILLAIMTTCISGVSIFVNAQFVSKTDPLVFTLIRNSVVVLMLSGVLWLFGHAPKLRSLTKREWVLLFCIGAVGGGIPFALFFTGLKEIGALSGNIIQKSLFLWVALLAVPFLKERISKVQIIGYLVLFFGMFVFGGPMTVSMKTGTWMILVATILWAIENVIAKITLRRVHPSVVSWGRMIFGLPFLLVALLLSGKSGLLIVPQSYVLLPIFVSSAMLTLYVSTWYTALSVAPATLVSSLLVLAPAVTAALSSGLLKKPVAMVQWQSYGIIAMGVILMIVERFFIKKPTATV